MKEILIIVSDDDDPSFVDDDDDTRERLDDQLDCMVDPKHCIERPKILMFHLHMVASMNECIINHLSPYVCMYECKYIIIDAVRSISSATTRIVC